jgi:hypothetical protein
LRRRAEVISNLKTKLPKKYIRPPKTWDYVSPDESIVADAKFFSYMGVASGRKSIISEHVWLLEKIPARSKFILFDRNGSSPEEWLRRWRSLLAANIAFLQLEGDKVRFLLVAGTKLEDMWQSLVNSCGRWKG